MKVRQLLLFILCLVVAASCKNECRKLSGKVTARHINLRNFNAIDVDFPVKLILVQDKSNTVTVETDSVQSNQVDAKLYGNTLKLRFDKGKLCNVAPMTVRVGVDNLTLIKAAGNINVLTEGELNVQNLVLEYTGAVNSAMTVMGGNLHATLTGNDTLNVSGQASKATVSLKGNVMYNAREFSVADYEMTADGENYAEINVLTNLRVNTTGNNTLKYKGNPKNFTNNKNGLQTLEKL